MHDDAADADHVGGLADAHGAIAKQGAAEPPALLLRCRETLSESGCGANLRHTATRFGCTSLPSGSEYCVSDSGRSSALNTQTPQAELSFADAVHQFNAGDRDHCIAELLEPKHHSNALLDASMILFNQVIEVLRRPQPRLRLGLLVSSLATLVPGSAPLGIEPILRPALRAWVKARLVSRSAMFAAIANVAFAEAVRATAAAFPSRRVGFALPAFGPANAIFAPDTFVFGVSSSLGPTDSVAAARIATCPVSSITNIASTGHPNAKGAQAHADAIAAVLPSLGL